MLPTYILIIIFKQWLSQWEWVRAKRVCKEWRTIVMGLWKPLIDPTLQNIIKNDAFMDLTEKHIVLDDYVYTSGSANMAKLWLNKYSDAYNSALVCACSISNIPVAMYVLQNVPENRRIACAKDAILIAVIKGLTDVVSSILDILNEKDENTLFFVDSSLKIIVRNYGNVHLLPLYFEKKHILPVTMSLKALKADNDYVIEFLLDNYNFDLTYFIREACRDGREKVIDMMLNKYKTNPKMYIDPAKERCLADRYGNPQIVAKLRNHFP